MSEGEYRVLGEPGEAASAIGSDQHSVLDANTAESGTVHAGLDGDYLSGHQGRGVSTIDPWRFVDDAPYAVTRSVHEFAGEPRCGDVLTTRSIHR